MIFYKWIFTENGDLNCAKGVAPAKRSTVSEAKPSAEDERERSAKAVLE